MLTLPGAAPRSRSTDASGTRSTLSAEPVPGIGADPTGFASLLRQSRSASMPIRVSNPLALSEPASATSTPSTPSSAASAPLPAPPAPASTSATTRHAQPAASPPSDGVKTDVPASSGSTRPQTADDADGTRRTGDADADEAPDEPAAAGARPASRARAANGGHPARRTPSQAAPTKGAAIDDADAVATGPTRADAAHGEAPPTDASWPAWLTSPNPSVRTAPTGSGTTASGATASPVDRRDQPILVVPPSDERLTIDSKSPVSTTNAAAGPSAFSASLAEAGGTGRIAEAVNGSGASSASNEAAAASAAVHAAAGGLSTAASSAPPPTTLTLATPLASPDFSQALGLQMSLLAKDGVQSAELHLNPAEMGPVSVQITMEGTNARVSFGADVAETRRAIEAGLPELASALRDAGFTLAGGGVSQHSGHAAGQSGSEGRGQGGSRRDDERGVSSSASLTDSVSAAARRVVTRGGLDLYA